MNIEDFREYCLSLKGATECFPFDETTLVFKVMGKMFALTDLESGFMFSFRSDPETTAALREKYSAVLPARYMNKKYWSCVMAGEIADDSLLKKWILNSYLQIVSRLPRTLQNQLAEMK